MEIFIIEGAAVKTTTQILLISPFKEIWEEDKSRGKGVAMQIFSYIEFMISKKKTNPFKEYAPEKKERAIVDKIFGNDSTYTPNDSVNEAMELYREWETEASVSLRFYDSNLNLLEKIIKNNNDIDLDERDDKGKPIHNSTHIARAVREADQVLQSMSSLRKKVEQELYESSRTKSNKEINPFER